MYNYCIGVHAVNAYSAIVVVSVCLHVTLDFLTVAKMLALASAAQAQCDNISNLIVLELKLCSLIVT